MIRSSMSPDVDDLRGWLREFADEALASIEVEAAQAKMQALVDSELAETLSRGRADEVAEAFGEAYTVLAEPVSEGEEWASRAALEFGELDPDSLPRETWQRVAVSILRASKGLEFDAERLPLAPPVAGQSAPAVPALDLDAIRQVILEENGNRKPASRPIGEAFEAYKQFKISSKTWHATAQQQAPLVAKFVAFVGPDTPLDSITAQQGFDWFDSRKGKKGGPLAPGTANANLRQVSAFFKHAVGEGWLQRDPIKTPGKVLYSMRHTAITRLHEAGVDPIVRADIEGHAREGGTGEKRYIKGQTIPAMLKALDSIDWEAALKNLR